MATRFISFNESCLLVLHYMPFKPTREYGPFASTPNERARPIPGIKWDCQITSAQRVDRLVEVQLLNYKLIESLEDPEESLVAVAMVFADMNIDRVPLVVDGVIQPFDARPRLGYQIYGPISKIEFYIEYDDVEDFIMEVRHQLEINHC